MGKGLHRRPRPLREGPISGWVIVTPMRDGTTYELHGTTHGVRDIDVLDFLDALMAGLRRGHYDPTLTVTRTTEEVRR